MRLKEVIQIASDIKPHAFSGETLTQWINEVEGMVQTEVMLVSLADIEQYTYSESSDQELLVKAPHSKLYTAYLMAMIDFANGEYNKYQNSVQMFNTYFSEYMRWYALNINPGNERAIFSGYYLSAYAIAIKHGYEGSEEEWVASLKGDKGDKGDGWVVLGYLENIEALNAIENKKQGDTYAVGTSEPYFYYAYDETKGWVSQGTFSPVLAESFTRGGTGIREGEDTDNAKYYAVKASHSESNAKVSEDNAKASEQNAKEYSETAYNYAVAASQYESGARQHKNNAEKSAQKAKEYAESTDKALFANALKRTVNAEIRSQYAYKIEDVSPIEHDIKLEMSGVDDLTTVTLAVHSKNLFDISKIPDVVSSTTGETVLKSNGNGSITVTNRVAVGTGVSLRTLAPYMKAGKRYIINAVSDAPSSHQSVAIRFGEGDDRKNRTWWFGGLYKGHSPELQGAFTDEILDGTFYFHGKLGESITIYNIQIEEVVPHQYLATEYEEYNAAYAEYTPNNDGTVEVKSISPTTVLSCDKDVSITATYNRDTNIVNDIEKNISSLNTQFLDVKEVLDEKMNSSELNQAVNTALTKAKESGEFDGADGKDGKDGTDGVDGKDGISVTHVWNGTILTVTSASGTTSADLKGEKGDKGEKGEQGIQGEKGADGIAGSDGYTPRREVDYWTEADKAEIKAYVNECINSDISTVLEGEY